MMKRKKSDFLAWPPLLKGTLLPRYKRFIAYVKGQTAMLCTLKRPYFVCGRFPPGVGISAIMGINGWGTQK